MQKTREVGRKQREAKNEHEKEETVIQKKKGIGKRRRKEVEESEGRHNREGQKERGKVD